MWTSINKFSCYQSKGRRWRKLLGWWKWQWWRKSNGGCLGTFMIPWRAFSLMISEIYLVFSLYNLCSNYQLYAFVLIMQVNISDRHRLKKRQKTGKKGKGRQWILRKKEQMRDKGYNVPPDTKYTGRKRKAKFWSLYGNMPQRWGSTMSSGFGW